MRRVKYLRQAEQDLSDIFDYIVAESGQVQTAAAFTEGLVDRCDSLAFLPGQLGRPRGDLAPGLRSLSHKTYLISSNMWRTSSRSSPFSTACAISKPSSPKNDYSRRSSFSVISVPHHEAVKLALMAAGSYSGDWVQS
jgi:toxin ParE1/3/4